MLERSRRALGFGPQSLAADKSYGTAPFLSWLHDRQLTPYIPVLDRTAQTDGKLGRKAFAYDAERDSFTCAQGHELTFRSVTKDTGVRRYKAAASDCCSCPAKPLCTDAPFRTLLRLEGEEVRDAVRALAGTEAFQAARTRRRKVEMLFAHLKRHRKIRRLRLRGLAGAAEEFLLAATAQNLRRLAKLAPA
jgi:hypothetical protein